MTWVGVGENTTPKYINVSRGSHIGLKVSSTDSFMGYPKSEWIISLVVGVAILGALTLIFIK